MIKPFSEPVYITRPLFPDINKFTMYLKEVWDSKWLSNNGKQHQNLEIILEKTLKVKNLSLFNNGTVALIVAIQSLRLQGEVITTPFTFPATPHVLTWNGIKPVFCDIESNTYNINTNLIESMITPQTTAILAVHVFGNPCNVNKIQEIADRYGLKVVYDAAHAFGTEIDGIGIGTFGDISMFSFHPTKLFHTAEGGALTFNDNNLKVRINLLKNFGIKNEEEVIMPGINGKMNELSAVMGILILEMFENEQKKRKNLLSIYRENLQNIYGIKHTDEINGVKNSYQYFCIQIDKKKFGKSRNYVHMALQKFNVMTRKYFFPLCSDYSCYRQLPSSTKNNLPIANKISNEVLCLPFYGDLNEEDIIRICTMLKEIQKK